MNEWKRTQDKNYIVKQYYKETRTMTFKEYWKQNKDLYKQLGVTEAAAYRIWCDAIDACMNTIKQYNHIKC